MYLFVPLIYNQGIPGSNVTPMRLQSSTPVLKECIKSNKMVLEFFQNWWKPYLETSGEEAIWKVVILCGVAWRGVAWRGVAWRDVCVCVCVCVCVYLSICLYVCQLDIIIINFSKRLVFLLPLYTIRLFAVILAIFPLIRCDYVLLSVILCERYA